MKVCKFYNESERRLIRENPDTIVAANFELVMAAHLLWKLNLKVLKSVSKVMKSYVNKAKVNKG